MLEGYDQYELTAYIDSGCSLCFGIVDNSIMSHNEAIEGLNIEIGGVQCVIPVLWATNQPLHNMNIRNNSSKTIFFMP